VTLPICFTVAIVVGVIAAIYTLTSGARASYVSGFRFYLVTGLLQSLPVLLILPTALLTTRIRPWQAVFGLAIPIGGFLRAWLQERTRTARPNKWKAWLDRAAQARQSSILDRLLLTGIAKAAYDDDTG